VAKAPSVATADGASFLAFEAHVTNFAQQTYTINGSTS
jgi:hypothetical protein